MSRNVPALLGIILSISAVAVSLAGRPAFQEATADPRPRLVYVQQRAEAVERVMDSEAGFIGKASERVERAEKLTDGLENAVHLPSDQDLQARAGVVIDANWPVFIQRYFYASGLTGVLSAAEQKTANVLGGRYAKEMGRFGLSPEQQKKAGAAAGELAVLNSKAKHILGKWPEALEIERRRILREARRKLQRSVPHRQADLVVNWLEEKIK